MILGFMCPTSLSIVKLVSILLVLQSYFFMLRMVKVLKNRYNELSERMKENINLYWFSHNSQVEKLSYYAQSVKRDGIP